MAKTTHVALGIGDMMYMKTFEADNSQGLYRQLWQYMRDKHLILYSTPETLPDGTPVTQIGFLNREGREDETEFDTWDHDELCELFWHFLRECQIMGCVERKDEEDSENHGDAAENDTPSIDEPTDLDYLTISRRDVLHTVATFYQQGLRPEVMDVVLDFASELTGMSVDAIDNLA